MYIDADIIIKAASLLGALGAGGSYVVGTTGGGEAHNNIPPYYALCYSMKK